MGRRSDASPWNDERDALIPALRLKHGGNWIGMIEELGLTGRVTADAMRVYHDAGVRSGKFPRPAHVAPVITSPMPARRSGAEAWEWAEREAEKSVERALSERFVDVTISDDRPIALSFISDQHISTSGPVQLRAMREDAELITRTDGLYAVLGGDGIDNHIKHRAAMVGGASAPAHEWKLYDHYLSTLRDKILALVSGNHDDWTRDEAGVDMVALLAERNAVHYCPDEAILRLNHNGILYRAGMRHQYRYGSSFNLTHAVKRWWEMGMDPWDIGVIGHHHEAAIEPFVKHGRRIWAARPGSYQVTSGYTRRYGFNHSKPTCPTFILFPNTHHIRGFGDVWEAADYLGYVRERWPEIPMRAA
jgi:hypothetical protein